MDHVKVYCLMSKYLGIVLLTLLLISSWILLLSESISCMTSFLLHLLGFVLWLRLMIRFSLVNFPRVLEKRVLFCWVEFYYKCQFDPFGWYYSVISYPCWFFSLLLHITERGMLKSPITIVKLSFSLQFCQCFLHFEVSGWSIDI